MFKWRARLGRTAGPPADFEARLSAAPERLVVLHTAPARYVQLYACALPFDSTIVNIGLSASKRENRLALDASKMLFRRLQVVSGFPVPCLFMEEAISMLSSNLERFSSLPARRAALEDLPAIIRGSARRDGKVLVKP